MYLTLYTAIFAVLFGLLEIEIEGPEGWSWYTATSPLVGTFTGYHFLLAVIVFLTLSPVWRESNFTRYVFHVLAWFAIEDTTWFVVNPSYGLWNMDSVWWRESIVIVPAWAILIALVFIYVTFGMVGARIPPRDAIVFALTLPGVWLFSWIYWPLYTALHPYTFLYEYEVIRTMHTNTQHDHHTAQYIIIIAIAVLCLVWIWLPSPREAPRQRRVVYVRV